MSLYLKKLLPYRAASLLSLLLADACLCASFCWLFCDNTFSLAYYNWLKYIDVVCIALLSFAILLGSFLLTPNMLRGEQKAKKIMHIIFDIIQMLMLIVLFLNLISFYENTEHIMLLISIALFMLSQIVLIIGGIVIDKSMMLVSDEKSSIFGVNNFVKTYDKTTKQTAYLDVKDVDVNTTTIKNGFISVCATICIVGYLLIGVLITLSLINAGWLEGSNWAWYVGLLVILVVLLALSVLLLKLKNSTIQFANQNKWMALSLIIINFMAMLGLGLMMYFNVVQVPVIVLFVMWCCLAILNYVLLVEYNRQTYLFKHFLS